jgi:hypothetical protein
MALNQNISLTSYDAQIADAQRRQKMAEMLQEQANAPFDIQSYKGVQAPIPWTAVLAKALQGGLAGYQGKKAQETLTGAQNEARSTAMTELMKPETVASGGYNMADKAAPAVTTQRLVNALNQRSPMPSLVPGGDVPRTERPMTGQESLNRAYGFGMSGNPILEAAAPAQIKKAQETVGVEKFISGLGPVHESVTAQLAPYAANGDLTGVQNAYKELTKPMTVGSTVQKLNLTTGELESLADLREKWTKVDRSAMTKAESDAIPPGQIMLQSSNGDIKYLNPSDANSVLRIQQDFDAKAPERAIAQAQLGVSRGQLGIAQDRLDLDKQRFTLEGKKFDLEQALKNNAILPPEVIEQLAYQGLNGDKSVFQNLGRGQQGAQNIVAIRSAINRIGTASGKTPQEIGNAMADANANYVGITAEKRIEGARSGASTFANVEMPQAVNLSKEAYSKLPRGQFVPFNKLRRLVDKNLSSPEQAIAHTYDEDAISSYARALNPTGIARKSDIERGENLLSGATSIEAHNAVLDAMQRVVTQRQAAGSSLLRPQSGGGSTSAPSNPALMKDADAALKKLGL